MSNQQNKLRLLSDKADHGPERRALVSEKTKRYQKNGSHFFEDVGLWKVGTGLKSLWIYHNHIKNNLS